jgi:hypothetical protein
MRSDIQAAVRRANIQEKIGSQTFHHTFMMDALGNRSRHPKSPRKNDLQTQLMRMGTVGHA